MQCQPPTYLCAYCVDEFARYFYCKFKYIRVLNYNYPVRKCWGRGHNSSLQDPIPILNYYLSDVNIERKLDRKFQIRVEKNN